MFQSLKLPHALIIYNHIYQHAYMDTHGHTHTRTHTISGRTELHFIKLNKNSLDLEIKVLNSCWENRYHTCRTYQIPCPPSVSLSGGHFFRNLKTSLNIWRQRNGGSISSRALHLPWKGKVSFCKVFRFESPCRVLDVPSMALNGDSLVSSTSMDLGDLFRGRRLAQADPLLGNREKCAAMPSRFMAR